MFQALVQDMELNKQVQFNALFLSKYFQYTPKFSECTPGMFADTYVPSPGLKSVISVVCVLLGFGAQLGPAQDALGKKTTDTSSFVTSYCCFWLPY